MKETKQHKKEKVGYSLASVMVEDYFSRLNENFDIKSEVGFNVGMNFLVASDLTHIVIRTTVKLYLKTTNQVQDPPILAQLTTQVVFNTKNLEVYQNSDEIAPPKEFLESIVNVAVSTSRGLFIGKNFGSNYAHLVLPLIDTNVLIPKKPFKYTPAKEKEV